MGTLRLLLDTHVLLWAVLEPHKLPEGLRERIEDPGTELLVSAASAWEMARSGGSASSAAPRRW